MKQFLTIILTLFILQGCKVAAIYEIDVNDFDKKEDQKILGVLNIEVIRCKDRKTGMEDDDIILLKSKVPGIFKGATYTGCTDRRKSYAQFEVPAYLDNNLDGKQANESALNYSFFVDKSGERNLYIKMPYNVRSKLYKFIKSSYAINMDDFMIITHVDFHSVKHNGNIFGVYLNDNPVQAANMTLSGKQIFQIPAFGFKQLLLNPNNGKAAYYKLFTHVTKA